MSQSIDTRWLRISKPAVALLTVLTGLMGMASSAGAVSLVSFSVAPRALSASGGEVSLDHKILLAQGSFKCAFAVSGAPVNLPKCSSQLPRASPTAKIPPNIGSSAETITFTLTVRVGKLTYTSQSSISVNPASGSYYVALGDFLSSGEGNRVGGWVNHSGTVSNDVNSNNGCDRSSVAYPELTATWLAKRSSTKQLKLSFLACSGADTQDLWSSSSLNEHLAGPGGNGGESQQLLDMGELARARIVTITMGGNDLNFSDVLTNCINSLFHACNAKSNDGWIANLKTNINNKLGSLLRATYARIESEAPNATLVVLGYPDEFPSSINHPCDHVLSASAVNYLAGFQSPLNKVISAAASAAVDSVNPHGAIFKDPNLGPNSFIGHDVCSSASWFNGPHLVGQFGSFHPNATGQSMLAQDVESSIGRMRPSPNWQTATVVPETSALSAGNDVVVNSVSCAAAGSCSAGGSYIDANGYQAFVVNEVGGVWQTATEVPGTSALNVGNNAGVNSVSCAAAGSCSAGGSYTDASGYQAFVANEVGGVWQTATVVPGTSALNVGNNAVVNSVSCAAAGSCSAGGSYADASSSQAFVANEVGGVWQTATVVPGTSALNAGNDAVVNSVSCAAAGSCSAGGWYIDASGYQAFVANEVGGVWQTATEVPGISALNVGNNAGVNSVSCAAAGSCSAGGSYTDASGYQAFVANEVGGVWQTATVVPGTSALNAGNDAVVNSVSCAAAGSCSAGGWYIDASGYQAFVANEVGGVWQTATEVPGTSALNVGNNAGVNSVSCAAAGSCSAGGSYTDASGSQAFVANEVGGVWQTATEVPGTSALNAGNDAVVNSVSCAAAGSCSAGGSYADASGSQAFVANEVG